MAQAVVNYLNQAGLMDDLDALGLLKVDCLALGMLSAIRRAFGLINGFHGGRLGLESVPAEDPAVYAMIQRAETVGVFQIESRAQMAMLPRLKPSCFYDLVIEVAIVRPGPIQGEMVHPYLRRRQGLEPVSGRVSRRRLQRLHLVVTPLGGVRQMGDNARFGQRVQQRGLDVAAAQLCGALDGLPGGFENRQS